jgi:hypothetical protein
MSREDFAPDLRAALDRFDAPPPRAGFADRVVASATAPVTRTTSRDRRGGWRLVRRVVIGTVAAGMVSAAAVASGLLGAAGIQVPVLTAMLAPEPKPKPKPALAKPKPAPQIVVAPKPPVGETKPGDPGLVDPGSIAPPVGIRPAAAAAMARRTERRLERRAFIRANPELVPVIKQAVKAEADFVRANPEIREMRLMSLTDRKAYLDARPDLKAAVQARQAERRAFREANPQAFAVMRARAQERRAKLRPAPVDPALSMPPAEGISDPTR